MTFKPKLFIGNRIFLSAWEDAGRVVLSVPSDPYS